MKRYKIEFIVQESSRYSAYVDAENVNEIKDLTIDEVSDRLMVKEETWDFIEQESTDNIESVRAIVGYYDEETGQRVSYKRRILL